MLGSHIKRYSGPMGEVEGTAFTGGFIRSGGLPGMGMSLSLIPDASLGTESSNPLV